MILTVVLNIYSCYLGSKISKREEEQELDLGPYVDPRKKNGMEVRYREAAQQEKISS